MPCVHSGGSYEATLADPNAIAEQFTNYYYQTFDTDRNGLAPLYRAGSMLSFEADQILGVEPIVAKLAGLPFTTVKHQVDTRDAQPSPTGGIIVLVTGKLITGDEANALSFSQVFHLMPEGASFYVHNDIFRLVYG